MIAARIYQTCPICEKSFKFMFNRLNEEADVGHRKKIVGHLAVINHLIFASHPIHTFKWLKYLKNIKTNMIVKKIPWSNWVKIIKYIGIEAAPTKDDNEEYLEMKKVINQEIVKIIPK